MRRPSFRIAAAAAAAVLVGALAASGRAEVKVTVAHNEGEKASPEFKFKDVPAPAKSTPAGQPKLTVTVVEGEKDDASAEPSSLTTGPLPTEEDEPDHNFFFAAGSEGGRVRIDLGSALPVKQVNTYSWHPNTRGPQVYTLYVADGKADGFNAEPKNGTDPATVGWTKVTTVDTRPKGGGEPGGQYGVSVADSTGGPMATARYVLLDCSRTESDDDFGNTFYSHVDVVTASGPATQPAK